MKNKIITFEQNVSKLRNKINALNGLIDQNAFDSFGRYAYLYDKNFLNGSKQNRLNAYKTLKNSIRLMKVTHNQIMSKLNTYKNNQKDANDIIEFLKLQSTIVKIQMQFI